MMKKILLSLFLLQIPMFAFSDEHCDKVVHGTLYVKGAESFKENERFSHKFFRDGKVECYLGRRYEDLDKDINRLSRIEIGSYKGIAYRIHYSDGSGMIQGKKENNFGADDEIFTNWSTNCEFDPMDDKHYCYMTKKNNLSIEILKDGSLNVSIGYKYFPGSDIVIRVDKNKPFTAQARYGFSLEQSRKIIDQMKLGKNVVTRYSEFPYRDNIDKEIDLYGFKTSLEILSKIYRDAD